MNRILVVDDSLSVRKVLERLLAVHADVTVAISAEDALEQLGGGLPPPDLLISDVLMPGMSGLDLTRTLRQRPETATLPIILISGILDDQLMQEARAAQVQGVVRKPFTAEDLLPVISEALLGSVLPPLGVPAGPGGATDGLPARTESSPSTSSIAAPVSSPEVAARTVPGPSGLPGRAGVLEHVPLPRTSGPAAPCLPVSAPAPEISIHDELMAAVLRKPGVLGVLVTTTGGEPLAFDGTLDLPAEDLAMYARFLANTAGVLGGRLGTPEQKSLQIDFSPRTLLIFPLKDLLLVCLLTDTNGASMIRFTLRRFLEA